MSEPRQLDKTKYYRVPQEQFFRDWEGFGIQFTMRLLAFLYKMKMKNQGWIHTSDIGEYVSRLAKSDLKN